MLLALLHYIQYYVCNQSACIDQHVYPGHIGLHMLAIKTVLIYTVSQKKGDTILLSISLLNIDRFSQFFYRRTQLELCNKIINKDPTSPQMCCYTTLWNVPTRQCTAHRARKTIKLLQRETPAFISPDLWCINIAAHCFSCSTATVCNNLPVSLRTLG